MASFLVRITSFAACLLAVIALGCQKSVVKNIPPGGTVPHGEVVYVENDGRCQEGQIIKITGGNRNLNIKRKTECIERK